jgi:hypothetical protein
MRPSKCSGCGNGPPPTIRLPSRSKAEVGHAVAAQFVGPGSPHPGTCSTDTQ